MIVRVIEQEDIPHLLQLYRHLDPDDRDIAVDAAVESWQRLKLYPGSDIFVACLDDRLVATCALVVVPNLTRGGTPYALVENVVTHTDYRRRGCGKAVLGEAVEAAWRAGCYKVMLLTGAKQPATLTFYQDAGFEQSKTGFQIRRIPPRTS